MFTANVESHGPIYNKCNIRASEYPTFVELFSMETIGDRIRRLAKERFGSQAALAQAMGMSTSQLNGYVTNAPNTRKPGADVLVRFRELSVSANWILFGEGDMMIDPDKEARAASTIDEIERVIKEYRLRAESATGAKGSPLEIDDAITVGNEALDANEYAQGIQKEKKGSEPNKEQIARKR